MITRSDGYGHPNSLKALELHRARTQMGKGTALPKCSKCNRAAVKKTKVCWFHGGASVAVRRRIADDCARYHRPRVAGNIVDGLVHRGDLPYELLTNAVFRAVSTEREKFRTGRGTHRDHYEQMRLNALRMLQLEMVRAWMTLLEHDDTVPWAAAVGKARELGLTGAKR